MCCFCNLENTILLLKVNSFWYWYLPMKLSSGHFPGLVSIHINIPALFCIACRPAAFPSPLASLISNVSHRIRRIKSNQLFLIYFHRLCALTKLLDFSSTTKFIHNPLHTDWTMGSFSVSSMSVFEPVLTSTDLCHMTLPPSQFPYPLHQILILIKEEPSSKYKLNICLPPTSTPAMERPA